MNIFKFGEIVKSRRQELGLKQDQVADIIGCSKTTISKIENGRVGTVEADTIFGLADALQWTLTDVRLAWEGKNPSSLGQEEKQDHDEETVQAFRAFLKSRKPSR